MAAHAAGRAQISSVQFWPSITHSLSSTIAREKNAATALQAGQHHRNIPLGRQRCSALRSRLQTWGRPRGASEHPLGATKVLSATIAVADLGEAARRFQHIYGLHPSEPFTGEVDGWDAMLVSFALSQSGQHFELAVPLPLSVDQDVDIEHLPGSGALARHLQQFGESLCRMTLAVESLAASRRYLDEHEVTYTLREGVHPVLWIHPDYACGASIVLHEQPQ